MRFRALLLLAIAAGIHAGPIGFEDSTCSTTCVPTVKFGYEPGRTYRFDYDAETVTTMAGAAEESSGIHIRTTADVTVLSPCELVLTLRDPTLEDLDPLDVTSRQASQNNGEFKDALEKNALRFSFQDGRVDALCASEDDPIWVVNFKRGILSAFQNSMDNFNDDALVPETDVSGMCEAHYSISNSGIDTIVIKKSKDLLVCTERTDYFTSLQATTYRVPSKVQSLPLLKSTHDCEQTVRTSGVLERSECKEMHTFRPFSNHKSGATTTVSQTLVFLKEVTARVMPDPVTSRSSLIFEHENRATGASSNKNEVRAIMEEICATPDIRPQTPALFSKLVYALSRMDVASLTALHRMVEAQRVCSQNSDMARKFFHDAIPAVGTASSVALINQLIDNSEVSGHEANVWLTSLAFIQEPTAEMIREAKPLVMSRQTTDAFLPVSSLVHTFCKSTECQNNVDVTDIISTLTQNLGYNCKDAVNLKEKVIMSLKALSNIGHPAAVAGTLARCAANNDLDMETRVVAIQAFHRLPCDEEMTENMLRLLRDINEDSELRIAAYLGVMKCPTPTLLDQIKTILATEEVNQVGSFIWTHLSNLMETSDPLKQGIRGIIEDDILSKEFNMDQRKFSRNYEGSIFWESLNAGAGYESNLIWSPSSFLPRSAMVNLTVDMFGKSVNLLEVGGRMQGIEPYLEKFFGPQGYFPESVVTDVIKQKLNQVDNTIRPGMINTPQASAYLKMFGDELRYLDLFGMDLNKDDFNILDILLTLAQQHEVDITKSMNFLDTEMTVATVAGLPLKLAVNGTATVDVKLGGKMDLRRTGTWPTSMDVNGYVKPSGAVTFASTMGVDAFMARTGLKMVTTLHSSVEVDGLITIEESKIMNVKMNVPKEKVEILNVESNFYIIHKDAERKQKMLTDNIFEKDMCTCDNFGKYTGMKICGGISLPMSTKADAPYFPFTGPLNAHVTLEMADTHTSYEFEARFESQKERTPAGMAITDIARVFFDTPGSRVNRRFLTEYTLDRSQNKLSMNLQTPWKEATIDGSITKTTTLRNANLKVVIDKVQVYAVVAELAVTPQNDAIEYAPKLILTLPTMEDMALTGKVTFMQGDKMEVDLSLNNVFREPVTLTGEIDKTNAYRYSTSLAFTSQLLTSEVSGFTVIKDALISTRTNFKYSYNGGRQHQFALNSKLKDSSSGNTKKYSVNTAIQTSEYPEYNMQLEMDVEQNRKHHLSSLEFTYGDNPKDLTKKITWTQVANIEGNRRNLNLDHNLDVKWLAVGVDFSSKVVHSHKMNSEINTQAVITYTPGKSVSLDTSIKRETANPLKGEADIQFTYPGREMRLTSSIDETQDNTFSHDMLLQWQTGRKIRTATTYTITGRNHQMRAEIYRPSGALTVLTGEGTVKLDDLKARLDLTHDGKSYSTALEYAYDFKPKTIEMSGKYDFTIPQRHVTLEGEVTATEQLYSGSLSTMWDADRDASKKVGINGRLSLNGGTHEGMAKVVYPGRQIILTGTQEINGQSITHNSEFTWATGKTIAVNLDGNYAATSAEGKLKIASPFFRDVTINANAEKARQETKGHFDIDFGKTMSVDVSMTPKAGWKNMEGSIIVHTPFKVIERLAISGSHDLISAVKTAQVEVNRNTNTFSMNGNLLLTDAKKEGMVAMNMDGQTAKMTVSQTYTDSELDHQTQVFWNSNTIASMDVKGGVRPAATWMKSKVISSWTPDFEMNADIKKERQELSSHIDITCVKSLSADASLKMLSGWQDIESSLTVHTPLQGYERFVVTANHDIIGVRKSILWAVGRNSETIQLTGNSKMDDTTVEANLELTTPCETLKNIAIRGTGLYDGSNFNSHIETEMMNKKVEMDVTGKIQGSEMEANAQLKTPFTQPIAVSVSLDRQEPKLHAEVEWASKKIELDLGGHNRVGYNSRDIQANVGLKTPYTSDLVITATHKVNGNQYTSNGMVQWGSKQGSVDFNMVHETTSGKLNNKGTLAVVTPWRSASATWDQDIEGFNAITSKNEIEWSGKKMALDITHKMMLTPYNHELNSELSLSTPFRLIRSARASVTYLNDNVKLQADANVNHNSRECASLTALFNKGSSRLSGNVAFKSVIPTAEDISMTVEMEQKTGRVEMKWAPGKFIKLQNDYNVETTGFSAVTTLTTSFKPVEKVTIGSMYARTSKKDEVELTIEYAPSKVISGKVGYGIGDDFTYSFSLTAPCPYFRSLRMSTDNTIYRDQIQHKSDFNFEMDGSEVSYTGALTVNGANDISATASINTPFRAVRRQTITLEHHLQQSEYVSTLNYQLNRQNVEIETHFMNTPREFRLTGDCKTSFAMVPSVSFSINHEGQGSTFNGQVKLDSKIARKPVSLTANYNVDGLNTITGDVLLKTPFSGVENVGGKFSHSLSGDMFTTTAEVQLSSQHKLTLSNEFSMTNGVHLATVVTTPDMSFRSGSINIDHSYDNNHFDTKTKMSAQLDNGAVNFIGNLKWINDKLEGLVELTTPFKNADRFAVTLKHQSELGREITMDSSFVVEYPGARIELSRNIKGKGNTQSEVVTFTSPFRGFENIKYEATFKRPNMVEYIYTTALTYAPQKKIETEVKVNVEEQSGSLMIDTPFNQFSHLNLEASHLGAWNDFNSKLKGDITLNRETYSVGGNLAFTYTTSDLSATAKVESNFDALREAELKVTHVNKPNRKFETTVDANIPGHQASLTSNLNLASLADLSGQLSLTGPKTIDINFSHKGDYRAFTNHVDCAIDGTTVGTYDGSLSTTLPVSAKFEFRSDKYNRFYQISVDAKGQPTDMTIDVDAQFAPEAEAVIHGSANWKLASGLNAGLEISCPKLMKDVKISIEHDGTYNFNHKSQASYGRKTITLTGNLNTSPSIEGQMVLRTPFKVIKVVTTDIKFSGNLRKFFTSFSFEHNNANTGSVHVSFESTNTLEGSINLESSLTNGFTAEFNHVADLPEVATTFNIKYKSMAINLDMRFTPTEGHFNLQTPWKYCDNVAVTFTHTGPWRNFENNVEIKHRGNTLVNTITKFQLGDAIEGSIDITTQFTQVRTLSAEFSHKLSNSLIQTSGSVKINDETVSASVNGNLNPWEFSTTANVEFKSINVNLDVAFSPAEGHFKLQTPWQYIEDVSVTFTHNGPWRNFQNNAEIKYNGKVYLTTATKFQLARAIEGSIDITTPFEVKTLSVEFKHRMTDRILRTSGSISVNGEAISASADFNRNPLDGTVKLNMPRHETVITLKHTGDLSSFENAGTFECSTLTFGKLEYSGKWESNPASGVFTLKSEKWDSILEFQLERDVNQFKNSLTLNSISGIKIAEYSGQLTTRPSVEGLFFINYNNRPEIKLEFDHDTRKTSFALNNRIWKNIDISASLQRGSNIEGDFKLSTPFERIRSLEVTFKHEQPLSTMIEISHNDLGKFRYNGDVRETATGFLADFSIATTNKWLKKVQLTLKKDDTKLNVEFSHNMVGTIEGSFSLETDPDFVGSLELKTPFTLLKHMQLTVKQDGSKVDVEFSHNKVGTMTSSGSIVMEPYPVGTFELKTPFKVLRNVQLTVKNEDSRIDAEFSHNMLGNIQCSCSLQTEPYPMASFELKTPFTILKNVALKAKAEPIDGGYNIEASFDHNMIGIMQMTTKLQNRYSMEGTPVRTASLTINTPFDAIKNLNIDFMHEFTLSGFHTNVIVNPNDIGKWQLDASMEMLPTISGRLEITTPWRYLESLSLTTRAEGSLTSFKTNMEFNHNILGKAVYAGSFEPWKGSFLFQSGCPYLKDLQLNFDHSITGGQLISETAVKVNTYSFKVTANGQIQPIDVTVRVELPTTSAEVHATFDGSLSNFQSGLEFSKDNRQLIKTGLKLDLSTGVNVEVQLNSPLTRSLDLSYTHTGVLRLFTCTANVKVDGVEQFSGVLSFDSGKREIELNMQTTLRKVRSLHALVSFGALVNGYGTLIDVTHNGNHYKAEVKLLGKGHLQVETTFPLLKNLDVIFDHSGDMSDFQASTQIAYNSYGNYKGEVTYKANPMAGSITLTTPLKGARNINAAFTHNGDSDQMQNHVEATIGGKKYTIDSTLNMKPFELEATITTPVRGYEEIGLKFNQKGNMKTLYNAHGEITYNSGKKVELDILYKFYSRLSLNVDLKTPFKDMSLLVKHQFKGDDITCKCELTYGTTKAFDGTLNLNIGSSPNGKLMILTAIPGYDELSVEFAHSMGNGIMSSSANANLFGTYMSGVIGYDHGEGKLELNTPFRGYEEITAGISNYMASGMLQSTATVNINGNTISCSVTGKYQALSDMELTAEIRTPFVNMDHIKLHAKQEGGLDNMKTELEVVLPQEHSVEGTFTLQTTRGVNANLKTNFRGFEDVAVTFDHESTSGHINTLAKVQYSANNAVVFKMDLSKDSQAMDGTITFTSPFRRFESLAAEIHHKCSTDDLESKILLSWADGEEIVGNIVCRAENGIPVSGSVTLKAPYMSEKSLEFSNNIQGNSIDSTGKVTWAPSKTMQVTFKASYSGDRTDLTANAGLELTTPFSLLREVRIAAEHEHSSVKIDNGVTFDYNSKRILESKVSMNTRTGTVTITGPFKVLLNYRNNRNGGFINVQHPFEVDASYTKDNEGLSMTMQKPYPMDATYKHDVNGGRVTMNGPVKVDGTYSLHGQGGSLNLRRPIQVDVAATYTGNAASLQMENPIKIHTNVAINRDSGSFVMSKPFTADASYTYRGNEGSFNMQNPIPVDASYTLNRNGGSLSVKQPYPVEASYTLSRDGGAVNVQEPIPIEASYKYTGNTGSISIDKPYQVHGEYNLTPAGASVELTKPFAIDAAYRLDVNGGSVSMRNPIRVDAGYTVNANGHSLDINSPIRINAEYKWFGNSGSFVMINPVAIDVEGKLTPAEGYLKMNNPYPIDTAYSFNWNSASMKMMQPYPIDVTYEVSPKKGSFVMLEPYPVDVSYLWNTKKGFLKMDRPLQVEASYELTRPALNDLEGTILLNWNKASRNSNVKVDVMHKDESTRYSLVKQGSFRAVLPTRTIGLSLDVEKSATKLKQSTEVTWDEARDRKVSYMLDVNRPSNAAMAATARIATPIRSVETSMTQSKSPQGITTEATMSWDSSRDSSKTVTVKNVLQKTNAYTRTSVTTISCPAFNRDIVMTNEITMDDGHVYFQCNHELEYSNNPDDKVTISARVADDGNHYYGNHNYTTEMVVRHPSSSVDMAVQAHAGLTDIAASIGASSQYLSLNHQMTNTAMRAEIHKLQDSLKMELDTPFKKAEMTLTRSVASGVHTYSMEAEDEAKKIDATLKLNSRQNSFEAIAHLNPSDPTDTITVTGSYPSAASMQLLATHGTPANQIEDAKLIIDWQDDNLLKTNVYWRPSLLSDFRAAVTRSIRSIDLRAARTFVKQAYRKVNTEISGRIASIKAMPDISPLTNYLSTEFQSFRTDYKVMQRELNRMYWKNEFYMKTIDRAVDATIGVMIQVAKQAYTVTKAVVIKTWEFSSEVYMVVMDYVQENFGEYIEQAAEFINTYAPVVMAKMMVATEWTLTNAAQAGMWIMETTNTVVEYTLDIVEEVMTWAEPYVNQIYYFCVQACETIKEAVTALKAKYNALMQSYPMRKIMTVYQTVRSTTSSVNWLGPVYNAHVSLSSKVQAVANKMAQHADHLSEQYTSTIYNIHQAVNSKVQEYINRPASQLLRQMATEVVERITWAYNYLGVEGKVKTMLSSACDSAIHFVKRNAIYLIDEYLHLDLDKIISYDPRNGDLSFQLWIPNEWPSMQTVPFTADVQWNDLWDKLNDIRENINVVPSDFNPWDYYYQYKPASMNPWDWIPPYKAIATINGQHIMTFDNKAYEFVGTCSYILATEVMNKEFTVVGNYIDRIMTVFVDGKKYDLTLDGKVTIDGVMSELPVQIESVIITRVGDLITFTSERGFTITMDTYTQLFTFEISGFFYNKVAGLLGTYTNEQYDDFLMANGQRTTEIDGFTGTWKLDGNCRYHANTARVANVDVARPSGRICKALFEDKISPFRNCFKVVNPIPFLKACVNDVEMTSDQDGGICRAATSYVFKCDKAGVPLTVPRACKHAQDIPQNPQSADVVFIMEQKQCNIEVSSKLSLLAQLVDKALTAKGLTGNRFGLVGFGGIGVHDLPHTHTVGGEIMGSSRAMASAADSLVFVTDGENSDTISALKMAAEYPFRAGVAKAVVVMSCGPCMEQDVKLDDVATELMTQQIQVHLLVEHEFMMAASDVTPKTNYLFGIDAESAYTKTDVSKKDLSGDTELFQQIAPPSDKCATLALDSQGSFFNLQKLKDGRVRYQKNFMDVFARRIAKTAHASDNLLGRPGEEPEQFYQELNDYLGSTLIDA